MPKVTVTETGLAAMPNWIKLTSNPIELSNGEFGQAWTPNALYHGDSAVDAEGWQPWRNITLEQAIERGYVVLLEGEQA